MKSEAFDRLAACPECGAAVPDGRTGCQRLFDEVLAREFGEVRYFREHRLTVDAYSLQHPSEFMRSAKSFAAHLTGMCAALESSDAAAANRALQKWLDGPGALTRPEHPPPGRRGTLTIAHVHEAGGPEAHARRVREWARSAWDAWRDYHGLARQWVAESARTPHRRRRRA